MLVRAFARPRSPGGTSPATGFGLASMRDAFSRLASGAEPRTARVASVR